MCAALVKRTHQKKIDPVSKKSGFSGYSGYWTIGYESNVIEAISMLYMYPHNIVLSWKSGCCGYSGYLTFNSRKRVNL